MSDASDADVQEQAAPVLGEDEVPEELGLDPEVPEADAVEQHQVVPDDDGYEPA